MENKSLEDIIIYEFLPASYEFFTAREVAAAINVNQYFVTHTLQKIRKRGLIEWNSMAKAWTKVKKK